MSGMTVSIRAAAAGDRDAVAEIITASYADDPELGAMVGGLHRPDAGPPVWRRTLVAADGSAVVGVASAAASRYHPGTAPANVVVHPDRRREGIGTALLSALGAALADLRPGPLWSTVDRRSAAALGFGAAAGFAPTIGYEIWQVGPGPVPPVTAPVPLTALSTMDDQAILDAWERVYAWGHDRDPAFATATPRDVVATETLPRFRRGSSHAAYDDDGLLGLCVLADFDSLALLVGIRPGAALGADLAAAMIAASLPDAGTSVRLEVSVPDDPVSAALAAFSARREAARVVLREPR
jgi:GNAT superfamily N-acetyltransferase